MTTADRLIKTKEFKLKTFGNSMNPLLHNGDVLFIKKVNFKKILINDILCIKKNRRIFTHRVIYKNKNYLVSKGDNNLLSDGKIYPRNIIGKVYKIKRMGKTVIPENLYLMQSTFYYKEIVKINTALEKNKLDFVFLKGLPLHLYYEGSHPKRIYADCDILIKKKQFIKASKVLKSLRYKRVEASFSRIHKLLKGKEPEITFCRFINGFPVSFDLHSEAVFLMTQLGRTDPLYSQESIDEITLKLLNEKRYIDLKQQKFPILSKENLFIYLLLHLYHHNFKGAFRYELIKQLILKEDLDLPKIEETIINFRLYNFIFPALVLFDKFYWSRETSILLKQLKVPKSTIKFSKNNSSFNIFDGEDRISSGIKRFKNAFFLSPNSLFRKSLIFTNKKVLYSIYFVINRRLFSFLSN